MRVGSYFILECIVTNDPQSPNVLEFKWFKGSTIIDTGRQWTISNFMDRLDNNKFTSRLITTNRVDQQYNGKYTCSVYDSMNAIDIRQSTNIIVEGEQLLHVT